MILKGHHPFDPNIVGGHSILDNLLSDSWYKDAFKDDTLKVLKPIAEKLLGHEPYQRYRNAEMIIDDLDRALKEL